MRPLVQRKASAFVASPFGQVPCLNDRLNSIELMKALLRLPDPPNPEDMRQAGDEEEEEAEQEEEDDPELGPDLGLWWPGELRALQLESRRQGVVGR